MVNWDEAVRENDLLRLRWIEEENRLLRESLDDWSRYVDPHDAFRDGDGTWWPVGGGDVGGTGGVCAPFADEQQLAAARNAGRALERSSEFAINGHENRINYIVGAGHTYKVVARQGSAFTADVVALAQETLDAFIRANRWQQRQQEIVRRRDRDGEVFLRWFGDDDGEVRVRFVEPDQVYRPVEQAARAAASFGIETDSDDVETVLGYWVDGALVEADRIQHRKLGVDRNVKRGVPLFYPVRR
jgi:hypothetical protein